MGVHIQFCLRIFSVLTTLKAFQCFQLFSSHVSSLPFRSQGSFLPFSSHVRTQQVWHPRHRNPVGPCRLEMSAQKDPIGVGELETFVTIGRSLIEDGYYNGVISAVIDCAKSRSGCIVLDSPSGTGKSQAGIALRELDYWWADNLAKFALGAKFKVVHLVWDTAIAGQGVYYTLVDEQLKEGLYIESFFKQCREFASIHAYTDFEKSPGLVIFRDLLQYLFENEPNPKMSAFDMAAFRKMHKLDQCVLVLFFDEIPTDPQEVLVMLTVREALRALPNVVTIFSGTSAKVSNSVSVRKGYSSSFASKPQVPCSLIITRLPQFRLYSPILVEQMHSIEAAVTKRPEPNLSAIYNAISYSMYHGGNPRLLVYAVDALYHLLDKPADALFESWQRSFSFMIGKNKFACDSWSQATGGLIAQINLLMEASCRAILSDVMLAHHFAFRAIPDNGQRSGTEEGVKLEDCGGWLYIADYRNRTFGNPLVFVPGHRKNSITPEMGIGNWQTTVFAPFEKDPLLYLSSCRQGGYFTVVSEVGVTQEKFRAFEVLLPLWSQNAAGMVNFQNPYALCNTGSFLEVLTALSVCNAAAFSERQRSSLCQYLVELTMQLGIPVDAGSLLAEFTKDSAFAGIDIPRCLFPGSDMPECLEELMGLVTRLMNQAGYDVQVSGLRGRLRFFRIQAKDRNQLTNLQIVNIAKKLVRKSGELGIIVVRGCCQYWTEPFSSDNMRALGNSLANSRIGKMYFISSSGEVKELKISDGELGRIILIQAPDTVLGRDSVKLK